MKATVPSGEAGEATGATEPTRPRSRSRSTRSWVAATRNPHKLAELSRLLPGVELLPPPAGVDPAEDGETYADNALIKARAVHAATGLPALADDSGVEVDALGGAPGPRSARFAGENAGDAANLSLLLGKLEGVAAERRTARYRCVAALVDGQHTVLGEGVLEGTIAERPRGSGGFGYDPAFVPEGESRTVAEMSAEEKEAISHRGRAVADLFRSLGARGGTRTPTPEGSSS